MAEWFKTRDLEEFHENAVKWHNCKSKDEETITFPTILLDGQNY